MANEKEKPLLSSDQARAVLEKNVSNIVRKAAAGRPLSKREMETVAQFAGGPSPLGEGSSAGPAPALVSSYEALGKIVGLHRASFPRILRDHAEDPKLPRPRANGEHSVKAWRDFLEANPEIKCKSAASDGPSKSEYELEKLRQQCRRLTFENDLREGLYVLKTRVESWAIDLAEKIKSILHSNLRNELPPKLEGLRAPEISAKMEEPIGKICKLIQYCQAPDDHRPAKE